MHHIYTLYHDFLQKMVLQKVEGHVRTEADGRRENPMNEFEPLVDDTLHGDTPVILKTHESPINI